LNIWKERTTHHSENTAQGPVQSRWGRDVCWMKK
jgi:hypothetical protein